MNIQNRPATELDKEYLRALHKGCYQDIVTRQFGAWDDAVQRKFFEEKWIPEKFQIVELDGKNVGMISVLKKDDHVFLSEIQIEPVLQGRGYGTHILEHILSEAKKSETRVRLQVLKLNRAVNLYLRLGFVKVGETDTHILMESK